MRALVTGITGNVGKAVGELLLNSGWEVVGVARFIPQSWIHPTDPMYEGQWYRVDLTNFSDIEALLVYKGDFDLVIMTHGTQQAAEIGNDDFGDIYQHIRASNLDSAVYLTDALIRFDKLNSGALIVYCSSIHATQPRASRIPYAVAKSGLEALVRGVAVEGAPNLRAIGLRLGQLDSMMKGITFTPEQFKSITDKLLLPPVQCKNIARFCLELYYQTEMTGCILDMDSGHSLNVWPK